MKTVYLNGASVYLRAMLADDKARTIAWYRSPLPLNAAFGESHLKEIHQSMWDATRRQYAIVRNSDDDIVGGAIVSVTTGDRKASVAFHMAPLLANADSLRADALRVVVPWLIEDHNMRRVDVTIASSDLETIREAENLGMFAGVRVRQFWLRPEGRVDAIIYQLLNPNMEHPHA